MRWFSVVGLLLSLLSVAAWTKEDYEIFDLVSALEGAEGRGTTFYSHLGVESGATQGEITKAYRKKSLELHPDKNPGVKNIHERFARLGVITQILRNPEGRERYNFFYKNGVPKWRGTGYYYSRYRPTLFHTIIFLIALTAGAHRLVMQLNYNKDRQRVEYFERSARAAAGVGRGVREAIASASASGTSTPTTAKSPVDGTNGFPRLDLKSTRRRKVKVPMVEGYEGGGTLELIVEGDQVFLPNPNGSSTPLSSLATKPSFLRTWPFQATRALIKRVIPFVPQSIQEKLPAALLPEASADELEGGEDEYEGDLGPDGTPTPMPRRSAKELRKQRLKGGKSRSNTGTPVDAGTPAETEDSAGEEDVGADGKKKKKQGGGKAMAMRRRKMAMKK